MYLYIKFILLYISSLFSIYQVLHLHIRPLYIRLHDISYLFDFWLYENIQYKQISNIQQAGKINYTSFGVTERNKAILE